MKLDNILNMAAAAAFAFAAASCSQEPKPVEKPAPEPVPDPVETTVFTTGLPYTGTRASLGERTEEGKLPILWSEGDCISVNGSKSEPLSKELSGSREATFTVNASLTVPYTAVYPASAAVSADKVKFASVQTPSEGGFDPAAALMAAYSEKETSLSFSHLCSYLKIIVNYPSDCTRRATKATFTGNGGEILAGEATVAFSDDGIPSASALTAGEKSVTLNLPAAGADAARSFLIALPPTVFTSGFRIDFSDAKGTFLKAETSASVPLEKGVVLNASELSFSYLESGTSDLEEVEPGRISIVWDTPVLIETMSSSYGRAHRLNDGRLMVCYTSDNKVKTRFSSNNGKSWSDAAQITAVTAGTVVGTLRYFRVTPDFAQLSATNPYKPGRIICAINERGFMDVKGTDGKNVRNDKYPYHISVMTSDDCGKTWSELERIYTSSTNFERGCYEPFVLELPDGTVQIYFADKTPYTQNFQNISVIESKDGGDTWGPARIVCYTEGLRDGMASATIYDGNIYVGIEHLESNSTQFCPQIVYNPVSADWENTVGCPAPYRFYPFETQMVSETRYSGAPYISQTDNYMIMSYQTVDVGRYGFTVAQDHRTAEVQICPKSEIADGQFATMRCKTSGPVADGVTTGINWPSLCPLGGDDFLLVYELHDITDNASKKDPRLCCVRGHITTSTPEFK